MTLNQTLWLLGTTIAILIAELIAGRHRGLYKRHDHLVNALTFGVGMAVTRPLVGGLIAAGIGLLNPADRGLFAHVPFAVALVAIVVVGEFFCYWVHRFAHAAKTSRWLQWLWKLHRTHHSGKYVNVVLVFRVNPFWPFVMPLGWVSGFAIYAGQTAAAAAALFLFSMWGLVTHSNFRWDDTLRRARFVGPAFRAFEHVFVTPGIHHTHHGYGRDGANYRNFGIFLSVYDTLFGTLHIPAGRPARYGLPGANAAWTEEVFFPFHAARDDRKDGAGAASMKTQASRG